MTRRGEQVRKPKERLDIAKRTGRHYLNMHVEGKNSASFGEAPNDFAYGQVSSTFTLRVEKHSIKIERLTGVILQFDQEVN
jgi:hypothetical protein